MRKDNKVKEDNTGNYLIGMSFLLPVVLMLVIYKTVGIYPFGEKTVLTVDLSHQYVSYFAYFKEILKGNHSLFYSFSKTLGGDLVGLTGYYLMSPLNIILLFFPDTMLPVAIEIISLIKTGLCGLTFYLFLTREKKSISALIFSTAYALMAYNIVYQLNIMWVEGMILLPLMVWGIQNLFRKKFPVLYIGALFFAIILDYYIGFMLCIFSVIYFVYYFFFIDQRKKMWDFKLIRNYVAASLLAGGMGMCVMIPVLKSLSGGKAAFNFSKLIWKTNFDWSDFFVKIFVGSFDYEEIKWGLPNVYCGMVCLFFLGVYFLNKKIKVKEKIGALLFLLVFYFSFYINTFNLIWHGFNPPSWYPYRYSFLFSFLVLVLAWNGFQSMRDLQVSERRIYGSIVGEIIFVIALWMNHKGFTFMSIEKYGISVLVVLMTLFLTCYGKKKSVSAISAILLCLCSLELCMNGSYSLLVFNYDYYEPFKRFVNEIQPIVDYVKEEDTGFYRMEKTFHRKQCDPMFFDYKGLSHNSSTEKKAIRDFMDRTGFHTYYSVWSYYDKGSTYAMDSLLNVRYILSREILPEPYRLLKQMGDVFIYENPYALAIGFLSDEEILNCSIENGNKFEVQNRIWQALAPEIGKDVFEKTEICDIQSKNLIQDGKVYTKINPDEEAYIEYTLKISNKNPMFGYLDRIQYRYAEAFVNGESLGPYLNNWHAGMLRLGTFEKGKEVKIRIVLEDTDIYVSDAYFYSQNMNAFQEYYTKLSEREVSFDKVSDTRIQCSVSNYSGKNICFFTIPYDAGWKAYVDGEKTELQIGVDTFLALEIPEGEHEIELVYTPVGLKTGIGLSGICLLMLLLWAYAEQKKHQIEE